MLDRAHGGTFLERFSVRDPEVRSQDWRHGAQEALLRPETLKEEDHVFGLKACPQLLIARTSSVVGGHGTADTPLHRVFPVLWEGEIGTTQQEAGPSGRSCRG